MSRCGPSARSRRRVSSTSGSIAVAVISSGWKRSAIEACSTESPMVVPEALSVPCIASPWTKTALRTQSMRLPCCPDVPKARAQTPMRTVRNARCAPVAMAASVRPARQAFASTRMRRAAAATGDPAGLPCAAGGGHAGGGGGGGGAGHAEEAGGGAGVTGAGGAACSFACRLHADAASASGRPAGRAPPRIRVAFGSNGSGSGCASCSGAGGAGAGACAGGCTATSATLAPQRPQNAAPACTAEPHCPQNFAVISGLSRPGTRLAAEPPSRCYDVVIRNLATPPASAKAIRCRNSGDIRRVASEKLRMFAHSTNTFGTRERLSPPRSERTARPCWP